MVLADDNFATIVAAIEEGRSIYANIQKFLLYLLSTNLGEVLVMFFGVALAATLGLAAGPGETLVLPLLATMILWINLVTDGFPALALGVDPPEPRLMERPPRDPRAGVITPRMWIGIAVASIVMAVGTLLAPRRRSSRRPDRGRRRPSLRPHGGVQRAGALPARRLRCAFARTR